MSNMVVFDKVSWHYPEGHGCPSLDAAKLHFIAVMAWLKKNNLLSDEGKEVLELGIDADFSIVSSMLNAKGNDIFKQYYSNLLKSINYSNKIDLHVLDDALLEYKIS